jgi:hypothetical protein
LLFKENITTGIVIRYRELQDRPKGLFIEIKVEVEKYARIGQQCRFLFPTAI